MRTLFASITSALLLLGRTMAAAPEASGKEMLPALQAYVREVAAELHLVPAARQAVLDSIAADIRKQIAASKPASLTFICTHNSRRSHMSQIWAQTAAHYYGLGSVLAYSVGTETTA